VTGRDSPPPLRRLVSVPTHRDHPSTRPAPVRGVDAWGAPVSFDPVSRAEWALLFFLSTSCEGCADVWAAAREADSGIAREVDAVVVVTGGPAREDPDEIRHRSAEGVLTIMSDEAWTTYRVAGPPFFVLIDGVGAEVATEGVVVSPGDVVDHVRWAKRKTSSRSGSGGTTPTGGGNGSARDHPRFSPGGQ
jgi:hypothetical protein